MAAMIERLQSDGKLERKAFPTPTGTNIMVYWLSPAAISASDSPQKGVRPIRQVGSNFFCFMLTIERESAALWLLRQDLRLFAHQRLAQSCLDLLVRRAKAVPTMQQFQVHKVLPQQHRQCCKPIQAGKLAVKFMVT